MCRNLVTRACFSPFLPRACVNIISAQFGGGGVRKWAITKSLTAPTVYVYLYYATLGPSATTNKAFTTRSTFTNSLCSTKGYAMYKSQENHTRPIRDAPIHIRRRIRSSFGFRTSELEVHQVLLEAINRDAHCLYTCTRFQSLLPSPLYYLWYH